MVQYELLCASDLYIIIVFVCVRFPKIKFVSMEIAIHSFI